MYLRRVAFLTVLTLSAIPSVQGIFFLIAAGAAALPALGFGAGGVVGGSIAAVVQSAFYGGATSGVFAALQSAGATGAWATYAGASAAAGVLTSGSRKNDEDEALLTLCSAFLLLGFSVVSVFLLLHWKKFDSKTWRSMYPE